MQYYVVSLVMIKLLFTVVLILAIISQKGLIRNMCKHYLFTFSFHSFNFSSLSSVTPMLRNDRRIFQTDKNMSLYEKFCNEFPAFIFILFLATILYAVCAVSSPSKCKPICLHIQKKKNLSNLPILKLDNCALLLRKMFKCCTILYQIFCFKFCDILP